MVFCCRGESVVVIQRVPGHLAENVYGRHVYSNPLDPSICPILSLGLKLLSTPFIDADDDGCASGAVRKVLVFDDNYSETRFCQWLTELVAARNYFRRAAGLEPERIRIAIFSEGCVYILCVIPVWATTT